MKFSNTLIQSFLLLQIFSLSQAAAVIHKSTTQVRLISQATSLHTLNKESAIFLSEVPPTPPTPVLYIINITSVNITWNYTLPPTPPTHLIVQCHSLDFGDQNFHNISGELDSAYFVYNQMKKPSFYSFRLLLVQNGTLGQPSDSTDPFINGATAPTGPPINLHVESFTTNSIKLSWGISQPEVDRTYTYHLFRGSAPGNLDEVDVMDNQNLYTYTGLYPGTTYYLAVQADIGGIKSILSEVISQATLPLDLPPLTVTIGKQNTTAVNISWSLPNLIDNFEGYIIYYAPWGTNQWESTPPIFSAKITSYVLSGLEEGVTYVFSVRYEVLGVSSPNSTQTFTVPSSVHCLTCTGVSSSEIRIEWNNNSTTSSVHYLISSPTCTSSNFTLNSSNPSPLHCVLSNNKPWTQCNYSISSLSSYGYYTYPTPCPTTNCITKQARPAGPPLNLTVVGTSSRSAKLSWLPVPEDEQNGPITFYLVICTSCRDLLVEFPGLSGTVGPLAPYTNYSFIVRAQNGIGLSPASNEVHLQTRQDKPSGAPCSLTLVNVSYSLLAFKWTPPPLDQWNGIITQYTVYYQSNGVPHYINVTGTNVTLDGLTPNTTYLVQVKAWTEVGSGPYTPIRNFSTINEYFPGILIHQPPELNHFKALVSKGYFINDCFSVNVSWVLNSTSDYFTLNSTTITYFSSSSSSSNSNTLQIKNHTHGITLTSADLSPSTNYTFRLTVQFSFGWNSTFSMEDDLTVSTPDCSGVITLVIVVLVLLSVLLLLFLFFVFFLLTCCCVKRLKKNRHAPPISFLNIRRLTRELNEYVTVSRVNRGDGQSSEDISSSINSLSSLAVDRNARNAEEEEESDTSSVESGTALIDSLWYNHPTISHYTYRRDSNDYLVPVNGSVASELSARLVPEGSSISSSLLSLSSAPP